MSSIMRARSGLMGRGEPSEVMGLSRAEGCWTFDARDRMPRPSRATAHHLSEITPTATLAPLPRAGSFFGAFRLLRRIPAIVSFLNLQPALGLVRGNRSSCPKPVIQKLRYLIPIY
jgi:hypothetical protein